MSIALDCVDSRQITKRAARGMHALTRLVEPQTRASLALLGAKSHQAKELPSFAKSY